MKISLTYLNRTPIHKGQRSDLKGFVTAVKEKKGDVTKRWILESHPEILAKYPRFVDTTIRIYSEPEPSAFSPRLGWQTNLYDILTGRPDGRQIYWYWERAGNTGKSTFALNFAHGGRRGYVVTGGRHADIFYAYSNEHYVFFDWPRDAEEAFPYRVLEAFKNGYFLNTKYESVPRRFPIPHVVVFANFEPELVKLSTDRWNVIEI